MTDFERTENEIIHMQVRLFRMASKKWKKTTLECADLFDRYELDDYIHDFYGLFHIQGDEANLEEIEQYLQAKGAQI